MSRPGAVVVMVGIDMMLEVCKVMALPAGCLRLNVAAATAPSATHLGRKLGSKALLYLSLYLSLMEWSVGGWLYC